MKITTQKIIQVLEDSSFQSNINSLIDNFAKASQPMVYDDIDISEMITSFEEQSRFILSKKWSKILDYLSKTKRNSLQSSFENSRTYLAYIIAWQYNYIQSLIDQIDTINDILSPYLIIPEQKTIIAELEELKKLKSEYKTILHEVEELLQNKDITKEFSDEISKIRMNLEELSSRETHIREMEQTVEQKKANIEEFSDEVESYKTTINSWTTKLNQLVTDHNQKLADITTEETSIKDRAKSLLNLVSEWATWKYFIEKRDSLSKWIITWIVLLILIPVLWIVIIFWWFHFITEVKWTLEWWNLVLLRLSIFLPFIILSWIAYNQYQFYKTLKEKYAFRSILSLSLNSFSDVISKHADPGTKQFIENSVNQIFESPLEVKWWISKKLSEQVIEKSLEKVLNLWEKVVDKTISG